VHLNENLRYSDSDSKAKAKGGEDTTETGHRIHAAKALNRMFPKQGSCTTSQHDNRLAEKKIGEN
jgi:hypothetical protein